MEAEFWHVSVCFRTLSSLFLVGSHLFPGDIFIFSYLRRVLSSRARRGSDGSGASRVARGLETEAQTLRQMLASQNKASDFINLHYKQEVAESTRCILCFVPDSKVSITQLRRKLILKFLSKMDFIFCPLT